MIKYWKEVIRLFVLFLLFLFLMPFYDIFNGSWIVLALMAIVLIALIYYGFNFRGVTHSILEKRKGKKPQCLYCLKTINDGKDFIIGSIFGGRKILWFDTYHKDCHKKALTTPEGQEHNLKNYFEQRLSEKDASQRWRYFGKSFVAGYSAGFYSLGIYVLNRPRFWLFNVLIIVIFWLLPIGSIKYYVVIFLLVMMVYYVYVLVSTYSKYRKYLH